MRAWVRLLALGGWTLAWFALWGLGALLLLPFPRPRLRWRQLAARSWAAGLARIIAMRRTVRGSPPEPPFLLVTNHLSYLDIILLLSLLRGVFVAKREMRSWPLMGPLANLTGTIWVNREVRRDALRVLDRIDDAISRGDGVILFAEGTTSGGKEVRPLKPALLDWAAREQYPVHFAALGYRAPSEGPPAELALCWWGEMPFASHFMQVLRMPYFEASADFAATPISAPTRSELATRLRQAIADRFLPVQ